MIWNATEMDVRQERKRRGIVAAFKSVDTCAAEFEAYTPYYYSTYEDEDETPRKEPGRRRVMILGGGPNRIGQGIEFDYCCCHASFALRELGIESIMVNSNPETVSTDYDTSDLLFFEPLTTEDVLNICDRVEPDGVIVQFGGQTPLNLARALSNAGVPIIGTSVDTIEDAEDREKFKNILHRLGLKQPASGIARNMSQARAEVAKVGFPALVRPSFVLGGRAMEICYDASQFERFVAAAFVVAGGQPVLIDRFLEDAIEVDVDAIADGQQVIVGGIMEHIEEAGVHSGDSACALPPFSLPRGGGGRNPPGHLRPGRAAASQGLDERPIRRQARGRGAGRLRAGGEPAGQPHRAVCLQGHGHAAGQGGRQGDGGRVAGRAGLLPRTDAAAILRQGGRVPLRQVRRHRRDPRPGNEIDRRGDGRERQLSHRLRQEPSGGRHRAAHQRARYSSASAKRSKGHVADLARRLERMGFELLATKGTAQRLQEEGVRVQALMKVQEGRPNVLDYMIDGKLQLVINTPSGKGARTDEGRIRAAAVSHGIPCITTLEGAIAAVGAMEALLHPADDGPGRARPLPQPRPHADGASVGPRRRKGMPPGGFRDVHTGRKSPPLQWRGVCHEAVCLP